jgi:hypothetical protein
LGDSNVQAHGPGASASASAETDKATPERYFRAVDKGLRMVLGSTHLPVVLACVGYYPPIFQSVTGLAKLAEAAIEGNPERTPDELLVATQV